MRSDQTKRTGGDDDLRRWMRKALHDLSQPLTALECGLFLGTLPEAGKGAPDADALNETIRLGLLECERLMSMVRGMQDHLQQGEGELEDVVG